MKIVICWQHKLTGYRGRGQLIEVSNPVETIKRLNERLPEIQHWFITDK